MQLFWLLACITPFGVLNRMSQWKTKSEQHQEYLGLFAYPVLQAADILLYQATHVPVGNDQRQHLELTRNMVNQFRKKWGSRVLELSSSSSSSAGQVPEPLYADTMRIMSLRQPHQKMSKSDPQDGSRINLIDSPDAVAKKIRLAVTDSLAGITYDPEQRPELKNLIDIYAALSGSTVVEITKKHHGQNMAEFKRALTEVIVEHLKPIQSRLKELQRPDNPMVDQTLSEGAATARALARPHLEQMMAAVLDRKEK
jgi:tryptophanyl-tRNA synthetase